MEPALSALTAEEWAKRDIGDAYVDKRGAIWCRSECGGMPYAEDYEPDRHALAALCLYGQPFGFTWEDVDLLRRLSELRVCYGMGDYGPPDMYDGGWITMLADRMAALLPPREGDARDGA